MIGRKISNYIIEKKIGEGGFGTIYLAKNVMNHNIKVALKIVKTDVKYFELFKQQLMEESDTLYKLNCEQIVRFLDLSEFQNRPVLIMEYLDGEDLSQRLQRGPIQLQESIYILEQLLLGLSHAHRKNIVHRDIKPSNIFLCRDNKVKILDFGLARAMDKSQNSNYVMGTYRYMAIECFENMYQKSSDIYALGLVFWEMLYAKPCCMTDDEEKQKEWHKNIGTKAIIEQSNLPLYLKKILWNMTRKNSSERWSNANDILQLLRRQKQQKKKKTSSPTRHKKIHRKKTLSSTILKKQKLVSKRLLLMIVLTCLGLWLVNLYLKRSVDEMLSFQDIPAGDFTMGCNLPLPKDCSVIELPKHKVTLDAFRISTYEVSRGLYHQILYNIPYYLVIDYDHPIDHINWFEAILFVNRLSEIQGLEPCYTIDPNNTDHLHVSFPDRKCTGYRLPTEAEWEYAARGGDDFLYSGSNELDEVGWYDENSEGKTHPVGRKKANKFGLYDMSGNVLEWCWDIPMFHEEYPPKTPQYKPILHQNKNPLGMKKGPHRTIRGGSATLESRYQRTSKRKFLFPDNTRIKYRLTGIRIVQSISK